MPSVSFATFAIFGLALAAAADGDEHGHMIMSWLRWVGHVLLLGVTLGGVVASGFLMARLNDWTATPPPPPPTASRQVHYLLYRI